MQVPKGLKYMSLILTFEKSKADVFEKKVIGMLVRDYVIYFSKEIILNGTGVTFRFYCRPEQEAIISYNMGVYAQTMLDFQTKNRIESSSHVLPDGFPYSILIQEISE